MKQNLFVLTASSLEAYQHYVNTIEEGFLIDSIKEFLTSDEFIKLKALYGDRKVKAWGATSGSQNIRNWEKMKYDDRVLIYRKKVFEYYASIIFKIHNNELAKFLWGLNPEGETWEYVYLLDNVTEITLPIYDYNRLVGNAENFIPMGFASLGDKRIDDVTRTYGSIDTFLRYLKDGNWINDSKEYSTDIKREIIKEKATEEVSGINLLEANLEMFLADRIEQVEEGMELISRQLDTGEVGRLDLLCKDKEGNLVVLELKKMKAGSSIIDQIQRYMGWVMEHKAEPGQKVRGIIIVGKKDTALEYAVKANPNIKIKVFEISFQ